MVLLLLPSSGYVAQRIVSLREVNCELCANVVSETVRDGGCWSFVDAQGQDKTPQIQRPADCDFIQFDSKRASWVQS